MKIAIAILVGLFAALCLGMAMSGDNPDAKAIAGIFYIPAAIFGLIDAVLWLWVFL